jgi:hypothetical protein
MTDAHRRAFPIGRVILCAIAAGLLYICVYFASEYVRLSRELEAATTEKIGAVHVDLSKAGQIRVAVRREFRRAHGISLILSGTQEKSLEGLGARVALATEDNKELSWMDVDVQSCRREGDEIVLFAMGGGPEAFAFVLDVQRPVPALAGQEQRLYAKYELCGLEGLVVVVSGVFALASGVPCIAILSGVVRYTRKHRTVAKQPESAQDA